jgi:uncharacterized protein YecE (DUF72 family)
MDSEKLRVGTAGWTIPSAVRERVGGEGTHLQRYASRFDCAEINSTFYRPHRPSTYARWAASVPEEFRFALKLPKEITHARRFVEVDDLVERFLAETSALGEKRGVLLVQLPPSFAFEEALAERFFAMMRELYVGGIACEPRHATWFSAGAAALLCRFETVRVAADPAVVPEAGVPGGWDGFAYYRLHGAPRTYYSSYDDASLRELARRVGGEMRPAWCIFDNTALGAATANALDLKDLLV